MDPHCVWALRNEGTARHALQPCGCDVPCQRPSPPRANRPRARKPPHAHACCTGPCARRITRPCRSRERCQVEAEDRAGSSGRGRSSGSWTRRGRVRTPYSPPLPGPMPCGADQCCWQASFPMTAAGQLRNGRARGAPSPDSRLIHRFMWMKRWNHDGRTLRAGCRARQGGSRIGRANEKAPFGASSSRRCLTARLPLQLSPRRSGRPAPDGPA